MKRPKKNKYKSIWISWERHRRTTEIAGSLHILLFTFFLNGPRWKKHTISAFSTLKVLHSHRPKIVWVQNPSAVLAIIGLFLKLFYRYKLIVDAHNEAIKPFINRDSLWMKSGILPTIIKSLHKKADLTLVTNDKLKIIVESNGGNAFVLPDKIPDIDYAISKRSLAPYVVFICSYAVDEPFLEVIKSAQLLPENIKIFFTGDNKKATNKLPKFLPKNVKLCGFLDDDQYINLLANSNVIMDFSSEEDLLVCGGYEAVALEKPLITSNTSALKKQFSKGAFHIDHNPKNIAQAIKIALSTEKMLINEIKELKNDLISDWEIRKKELLHIIDDLVQDRKITNKPLY